jgi:hypothetical protein
MTTAGLYGIVRHLLQRSRLSPITCVRLSDSTVHGRCSLDRVSTTSNGCVATRLMSTLRRHRLQTLEFRRRPQERREISSRRCDFPIGLLLGICSSECVSEELMDRSKDERVHASLQEIPKSVEALRDSGGIIKDARQVELWERISKVRFPDWTALFADCIGHLFRVRIQRIFSQFMGQSKDRTVHVLFAGDSKVCRSSPQQRW